MRKDVIESAKGRCQSCGREGKVNEVFVKKIEGEPVAFARAGSPATWWLCDSCLRKREGSARRA
jgi:hypothetical protein